MHQTLTVDLLADWRSFADPLYPAGKSNDWQLYGTVTIDGRTGGLTWKPGGYAIVIGATLRELSLWERIDVSNTVAIGKPAGHERAPQFAIDPGWGSMCARGID